MPKIHQVPKLSQSSPSLCWEASGRMMWAWKHRTRARNRAHLNEWSRRAGSFQKLKVGLTEPQMNKFYTQLGMRHLSNPGGANVRFALSWSPVIVTSIANATGHAMVVIGHNHKTYFVADPCGVQSIDFSTNAVACAAAYQQVPRSFIDSRLGTLIWYW